MSVSYEEKVKYLVKNSNSWVLLGYIINTIFLILITFIIISIGTYKVLVAVYDKSILLELIKLCFLMIIYFLVSKAIIDSIEVK